MIRKIAIFMSGPIRYAPFVAAQLPRAIHNHDFEVFYHLWTKDTGNKVRRAEQASMSDLLACPHTKVVIAQTPYNRDVYADTVGTQTNSNSVIEATMGMFCGVNQLCHYLNQLPDSLDFSHVLRLRTDCLIISDDFGRKLDPSSNVLTFSDNPHIPEPWVSDHICFAEQEKFFAIWKFDEMSDVFRAYIRGNRNPESTLAERAKVVLHDECVLSRSLKRYVDYHIVYSPPLANDPDWLKNGMQDVGVRELFQNPLEYVVPTEAAPYWNAPRPSMPEVMHNTANKRLPFSNALRRLRSLVARFGMSSRPQ